jgi:hypothetical protein
MESSNEVGTYYHPSSAGMDIYYDIDKERQIAGLQSIINGYVIDIQMLEMKIQEVQKELDIIKNSSDR